MIRVGIYGATGYTGWELVKLLRRHPAAEIVFATSQSHAGQTLRDVFPAAPALPLVFGEEAAPSGADVVFLCLPHAAAAQTALVALEAGARVIDLSADFRLRDADTYAHWYAHTHPAPHLLAEAVYGLTEVYRAVLPDARLVANPGCYPTSILMALHPLLLTGTPLAGPIIADSKSGVSGAGRAPTQATHFVEVDGNLSPYKIGRAHRHLPEMEQAMGQWRPDAPALLFTPHLLPVPRGILSTIYVTLADDTTEAVLREWYAACYDEEPFIELLPPGEPASLAHVNYTNRCAIGLTLVGRTLILTSAIDNLIKGAAGQAVQNMNGMLGCDETVGLL
jgi:N-acetyl-gamma-glutamyl-phosphate reductase